MLWPCKSLVFTAAAANPSNNVQYSEKFMHGVVLQFIVLLRSLLHCVVNLLYTMPS